MRRNIAILITICFLFATIFGCGAIINGTRQNIQANSSPSGATISVSPTNEEYTTPASMSLERKNNYVLNFSKEGYTSAKFNIHKKLSGGMLVLDILFTGLLGVIVDGATGAWYNLMPDVATVSLEKIGDVEGPEEIDINISLNENKLRIESNEPGVKIKVEQTK